MTRISTKTPKHTSPPSGFSRAALNRLVKSDSFTKLTKWSRTPPKLVELGDKTAISKENHPDGFTLVAYAVKGHPDEVVFARTGGFAGITEYTEPLTLRGAK